ncbi:MAG: hypothetical protein RMI53_05840 [Nitrososphaerota archaeon]|nr:hypothetical protein [Nitrososphaerota archaeon]
MPISHEDLLSIWKKGFRNGSIKKFSHIERAFFRAAIYYSKIKGKIINPTLISKIKELADRVLKTIGTKIFEHGLNRAQRMLLGKTYKIFPIIRKWINEDSYIMWLGTEILCLIH